MTEGRTRLRPPRHWLDRRARAWWRAQLAVSGAVPALPLVVLGVLIEPARTWLLVPAAVVLAATVLAVVALPPWWYRLHRWEVTDRAVYARGGVLWQTWRVAPMSRIQTVDTTRGPLQRAFGLSTVTVTTASSAGAVKIEGLDHERAADLSEELTRITHETPGDAT
ncbi:PH domain-containing protein [Jiangella asiatica]|uniref:PH domain-containing protein n=1 Tax=Jiangella asiatica TaxID=2530372 RepID=A0A4V2Z2D3_9ACTN|nr:PH domain-containing protein [Jiangella asiatica]TDE07368.1 PH domain-containing protein [Jiangella asiatica]